MLLPQWGASSDAAVEVNPGPVPVHRALPTHRLSHQDVDHLVEERLGYLHGPPDRLDHVKRPLRHDRDVNDVSSPRFSPPAATVGALLSLTTATVELARPTQQGHVKVSIRWMTLVMLAEYR